MSQYENFFSDFGLRCFEIFGPKDSELPNMAGPRDVTTALCVLAGALIIPHERLRPACDKGKPLDGYCHHPNGDGIAYKNAANEYIRVLGQSFLDGVGKNGDWKDGEGTFVWGNPGQNHLEAPQCMTREKKTSSVLTKMRNALAHGNIETIGPDTTQIERCRFISIKGQFRRLSDRKVGTDRDVDFVEVSTEGLKQFMQKWRAVLKNLGMLAKSPSVEQA